MTFRNIFPRVLDLIMIFMYDFWKYIFAAYIFSDQVKPHKWKITEVAQRLKIIICSNEIRQEHVYHKFDVC